MKLLFATEAFRNECNSQDRLVRRYGVQRARLIRQRLDELFNAEVLEDIRSLPHVGIHARKVGAEGADALAVEVGPSHWLAFRPEPSVAGRDSFPGNWKKVDCILILGLVRADEKSTP
jgi:hypothetical protein